MLMFFNSCFSNSDDIVFSDEEQNENVPNKEKEDEELIEDNSVKEELSDCDENNDNEKDDYSDTSNVKDDDEENNENKKEDCDDEKEDSGKETTDNEESEQEELTEGELNLFKRSANEEDEVGEVESDDDVNVDLSETEEEKIKIEKKTKFDKKDFVRPLGPLSRRQTDGNIMKNEANNDTVERPRTAQEKSLSPSPPATDRVNKKKRFENRKIKRRQTEANYKTEFEYLSNKTRPQSSSGNINTTRHKQDQTNKQINENDFIRPVLPLQKEHTVIETSSREKVKDEHRPMTAPSNFKSNPKVEKKTYDRAPSRIVSARLSSRQSIFLKEDETRPCSSPIRSSRQHRGRISPLRAISVLMNDSQERPLSSGRPPSAPVEEVHYNPSKTIFSEADEHDTHRRTESPTPPIHEGMEQHSQDGEDEDEDEINGKFEK